MGGCVGGVTFTIIENGIGNLSLVPQQNCFHFTLQ